MRTEDIAIAQIVLVEALLESVEPGVVTVVEVFVETVVENEDGRVIKPR